MMLPNLHRLLLRIADSTGGFYEFSNVEKAQICNN